MASSTKVPNDEVKMAQLWIRFKADDQQAFDQLVAARYRTLYNYAIQFTKDRDFIKDCIQDLFLVLWNRRHNVVETPYVTIYLIKALRYNIIRKLRSERLWRGTIDLTINPESFVTDGRNQEVDWIYTENQENQIYQVKQFIGQLPKRQQEVVFLKFYEGLSNEDISSIMDIEKQTVANFLHRAVLHLRKIMPFELVC